MRVIYASILLALSFPGAANAQTIVNGSFEPTTSINPCTLVSNNLYNSKFGGNSYAFSTLLPAQASDSGGYELFTTACGDGSPVNGTYYLSMEWSDGSQGTSAGADAVSLKLSAALDTSRNYILDFYAKKTIYTQYGVPSLAVGYSTDSVLFGNYIGIVAAPDSSTWGHYTYTFKPHTASRWITVKADSATNIHTFNYIDVDAFTITEVPLAVTNISEMKSIQLSPNPFTASTSVTLSNIAAIPCSYALYDVAGRQVMHQEGINSHNIIINRQSLSNGLYFLKIMDNNNTTYTTKLIAQ